MNALFSWSLVGMLALVGCKSGTAGGPGAVNAESQPIVGQADETFRVDVASATIRQGETKSVSITITRAKNFDEDVEVKFAELPSGLSMDDSTPAIPRGATEAKIALTATQDAALGDFSVQVTGHPTTGGDATNTFKVTVTK